jgi:hypothetical protein
MHIIHKFNLLLSKLNYGEVIDSILSILQFIPATLLCTLAHTTMNTYSIDEIMFNDIVRARMYMLEEWAADGDPYRLISLTESYRTMSPSVLATAAAQQSIPSSINNERSSFQEMTPPGADFEAATVIFDLNINDFD